MSTTDLLFAAATLPLLLTGLGVGLVVGLTGLGAGSLMTPILIFFFGIPAHIAVGTDLLFAAITRMGGSVSLSGTRQVDWPIVGKLALGSVPAALLVLLWLHSRGPAQPFSQALMVGVLGVALVLTAAAMLAVALRPGLLTDKSPTPCQRQHHRLLPVLLGAGIGALVSLTSVGAGAIGVAALALLYPWLGARRIAAADVAHAVPLTLVAGLGHAALGSVNWLLLGTLLAGSLPGVWLGIRLAHRAPQKPLRIALAVLLAGAGVLLVLR